MQLPLFRSFKLNKAWIVLAVAIVIGSLAALAARSYLSDRVADLEGRARGKNMAIVVAKADMNKGTKLSSDNVAVRPIPAEFTHSSAITPEQFDRIDGQQLAFSVKAGEMILWGLLEGKKVPTFSARIDTGRRAITVPVDEINSISGMLEPGDLIDLMVTVDQQGKKITLPLLQSVQVMATGQRSVDDPKSGERRLYSTVTLDTDPAQAQNVIVAREAGRLTALLRNPQDNTLLKGGQGDLAALLGGNSATVLTNKADGDVPVLYGGRAGKFPPEGLRLGQYVQPGASDQQIPQPTFTPPVALSGPAESAVMGSPPTQPTIPIQIQFVTDRSQNSATATTGSIR